MNRQRPAVTVKRDPFARGSLMRRIVPRTDRKPCAWCGYWPGKYQYGWHADEKSRPAWEDRCFCSISCRDAYYN